MYIEVQRKGVALQNLLILSVSLTKRRREYYVSVVGS